MSFGEALLKKYGWKEGKGLGREENGITKCIRPHLKSNKSGLGHNLAEEFVDHWWDHAYNKMAKNITVNKNERGEIQISKTETQSEPVNRKISSGENDSYGSFLKGGVLKDSIEVSISSTKQRKVNEESQELTKHYSNEELFKLCGGLTAHKGARHGITMNAKLSRLEQQEKAFVDEKYNEMNSNDKRKKRNKKLCSTDSNEDLEKERDLSGADSCLRKKKKKKRKHLSDSCVEDLVNDSNSVLESSANLEINECSIESNSSKKKKEEKKQRVDL